MNNEETDVELYEEPESLAEVIAPLVPLIENHLRSNAETAKAQVEVTKMVSQQDYSLKSKQLDMDLFKFKWLYVLASVLLIMLIGIAAGVIFVLRDVERGVLIISHLVALAIGILGGIGIKKAMEKEKKD